MSLSEWLDGRRDKKRARQIQRYKKAIKNKFGQGEDRQKAFEFFKALGGIEGHLGLLERFMVNVEPSIRDEDEKETVFLALVDQGPEVVAAVEAYLNRKDAANVPVTWPLKVLDAVCDEVESVGVIIRALEEMGTSYTREPERKVALIAHLADHEDERVGPALVPFLRDHRDEVRLEALVALTRQADENAREAMIELMIDEDTPVRIRAAVADAMRQLGWGVKGFRKKVEEVLPEGLSVDRSGRIKGRWALAPADNQHEES